MSCWKISKNEIEKTFKKELTITCHSDMIQKLLRQPKTNRINASDEVDLWKLNKVRQTKCVGRLDSIQDNKHFLTSKQYASKQIELNNRKIVRTFYESLILAQDERWRRA